MEQAALCGFHAQNAQCIDAYPGQHQPQGTENYEPPGLIKTRRERKAEKSAPVIPYAIAITGNNPELIVAGWKVSVKRFMLLARGDPIFIEAFQFEFVLGLFRSDKAQGGKLEFHMSVP